MSAEKPKAPEPEPAKAQGPPKLEPEPRRQPRKKRLRSGDKVHLKPPDGRCVATSSRSGKPCRGKAIKGGYVCVTHGGAAPQVKRKAAERVMDMLAEAMDPKRVLREAGRLAFSDIRELFDEHGNFLPVKQWPEDIARAVSSVEVLKKNVVTGDGVLDDVLKVRLWDKTSKLSNLMKFHGQLTDKLEVSVKVDVVQRLEAGRQRVAEARQRMLLGQGQPPITIDAETTRVSAVVEPTKQTPNEDAEDDDDGA